MRASWRILLTVQILICITIHNHDSAIKAPGTTMLLMAKTTMMLLLLLPTTSATRPGRRKCAKRKRSWRREHVVAFVEPIFVARQTST